MKTEKAAPMIIVLVIWMLIPAAGCGRSPAMPKNAYTANNDSIEIFPETIPLSGTSASFPIPIPRAAGENAIAMNGSAEIDTANANDGYIKVRYLKQTDNALRVIVQGPNETPYIYRLSADGKYAVFPVSEGSGYYRITVYENVFDNKYSTVLQTGQAISLSDECAPFLCPNQYVNYNTDSKTTETAAGLTSDLKSSDEKIAAIYQYVITHISYDYQLADSIQAGYLPDADKVLESGAGICFDHATVMAAMLRSQGVPAKLVVGYRGTVYHAWVSVYSAESGWRLMDPTLASGSSGEEMGDEQNYHARYFY